LGKASNASEKAAGNIPLQLIDIDEAPETFLEEWPESGEFYRATEHAIPGFTFGYLVAQRAGVCVAVIPYFITDFKLNTMLDEGWLKRLLDGMSLRIACIGHPTVAFGRIDGQVSEELLGSAFAALSAKAPVVAFKGFGNDLPAPGFVRVAGLPVAVLHLGGDFWSTLHNHKKRNDFTRKFKSSAALRFEEHDGLPVEYLEQVYKLYLNTRSRSSIQFECLSPEYFSNTSALSIYVLAFLQDRLVGFAQLLPKGNRVVGTYLGMDYEINREHGLYFAFYLRALDMCARRGYKEIDFGETGYHFKKELGCELVETWTYYRHRNPFAHALLKRVAFLLEPSGNELLR
jgi:Acetyltransferase (GNAT) domain